MNNSRKWLRSTALVLILLFGTGLIPVSASPVASAAGVTSMRETNRESAMAKIESGLKASLALDEPVGVIIYLKDQLDSPVQAKALRKELTGTMTSQAVEQTVSRSVVQALRTRAETTQLRLLDYLEREKAKGTVSEFRSFFIANVIYAKADPAIIENLAFYAEVDQIFKNKTHRLLDPVQKASVEPSALDLEWNIERVKADQAWGLGVDGTGVVVANMDTGVEWDHPALKEKWRGYDPLSGETDPSASWFDPVYGDEMPSDYNGHGTHVMGTMVGQEPDGSNQIGVAPGAQWIAARILDAEGWGTDDSILAGAQWIIAPGDNADLAPDIVNNSWGGGPGLDDWFRDAVINWRAAGIFPVFAAGNQQPWEPPPGPGSIAVPANYPESFAVAATTIDDIRASFSLLGPSPFDESLIKPEISAPGENIRSSVPGGDYQGGWSGTSMAAPHIAGVAALLRSADSSLTVEDLAGILTESAVPLTDSDYPNSPNFGYGYGLVDALEAMAMVAGGSGIVQGSVLIEGTDGELPVIVHEQTVTETFAGTAVDITAQVSDDVSVVGVDLLVKPHGEDLWIPTPMKRIAGDHQSGTWKGTISEEFFQGDGVTYKIMATDYDGKAAVTPDHIIARVFGILPDAYTQGFEQNTLGWTLTGDWEWGSSSGMDPAPYEGDKFIGTRLGTYFTENMDSWLISPPIDLRDAAWDEATLRFHHWLVTLDEKAYGRILVTNDNGETFTQIGGHYSGVTEGWREIAVDLAGFAGSQTPVYVAFNFLSETWMTSEGWYIDNVRLVGADDTAPRAPAELMAQTHLEGIRLLWTPPEDGDVKYYRVFRSDTSGGPYAQLDEVTGSSYIDSTAPLDQEVYYVVSAVDISGNEGPPSAEAAGTAQAYSTLYGSDFELDDGGFVSGVEFGSDDWQWGIPTTGPSPVSGEKLWATNLTGNYSVESASYLASPDIAIPVGSSAILTFSHWFDFDSTYDSFWDAGELHVSLDGGVNWNNITPTQYGQYGGHVREWIREEIDLAEFEGQSVRFRFYFYSDDRATFEGWYIDDFYVMGLAPAPEEPAVNSEPVAVPEAEPEILRTESPLSGSNTRPLDLSAFEHTLTAAQVAQIPLTGSGIPAQGASVTVMETGRSVRTDPATGNYRLRLAAGEYTLVAEAYGYQLREAVVTVPEDGTVEEHFLLDPLPRGSISGRVIDRYYGNGAAFAEIRLLEDPNVAVALADEEGYFTMPDVIIGDYTLRASALGFEPGEAPVTVEADVNAEVEIGLKRFVGYETEIIYDDGTPEDAIVLNAAPNGLAVRFTPETFGSVRGATVYLWDESFPTPGGNRLGFNIYGVDENGKIFPAGDPVFVDDLVRGDWNYIDLTSLGFATDGEFYISSIQDASGDSVPAIGLDADSPDGDRSYLNIGGDFIPLASEGFPGAIMIRAVFSNSVSTPVFTNLADTNYTNQDTILVEGAVDADGTVNLYLNGELALTLQSVNKTFSAELPLTQEISTLRATAELDGVETEPSPEVILIKDQVDPFLEVYTPADDTKVNVELIRVTGHVSDDYLDQVTVNGKAVTPDETGAFSDRVLLEAGENLITVEAVDLAGNRVTEERTVTVHLGALSITGMEPHWDVEAEAGDRVAFSFRSNTPGAMAFYTIALPIGAQSISQTPMEEVEPGSYRAFWTVPEGVNFRDASVNFELLDEFGNRTAATAPGTLSIGITPEAERIAGADRYLTSVEASRRAFAYADTVILASGRNFPDALAGAPLAAVYQAPILLIRTHDVGTAVLDEIQRLGATKVILLGGESVISAEAEAQLSDYDVERIAGANRSLTAVRIGQRVIEATGSKKAILVNGWNFPDALSSGPAAALDGTPILFAGTDTISQATLDALVAFDIEEITLIGGPSAISDTVKTLLTNRGYAVDRIQGATRYLTALAVAEAYFDSPKDVVITTGENYPDGLSGGPLATKLNAPILLVRQDTVIPAVLEYLQRNGVKKVIILGGEMAISHDVLTRIQQTID